MTEDIKPEVVEDDEVVDMDELSEKEVEDITPSDEPEEPVNPSIEDLTK
jgi:hypothetical protein